MFLSELQVEDLVPADLWGALLEAEIIIANYRTFLPRTAKEMQGVAANTRKVLTYGKKVDPFIESPEGGATPPDPPPVLVAE